MNKLSVGQKSKHNVNIVNNDISTMKIIDNKSDYDVKL